MSPFANKVVYPPKKFASHNASDEWIYCNGTDSIDLKTIFHEISVALKEGNKHFREFYSENTAIKELQESTFEDITFDIINIVEAHNLSQIHTKAFAGLDSSLILLVVYNTLLKNNPPNHDIFAAINTMHNIEGVYLFNSLIEEIPDNAFRPPDGTQNKLSEILLFNNKIREVGNNAFNQLNSLQILQLDSNPIDHIFENAFNFLNSSESHLELYLDQCSLNGSSFEKQAFSHLNRPTVLYFNYNLISNNIKFLDQHIFEEFFNNNNNNGIVLHDIDCNDCRSFWLFSNQKYSKRSSNQLICSNNKQFTDGSNFPKCV
jgi:hypothetical protein